MSRVADNIETHRQLLLKKDEIIEAYKYAGIGSTAQKYGVNRQTLRQNLKNWGVWSSPFAKTGQPQGKPGRNKLTKATLVVIALLERPVGKPEYPTEIKYGILYSRVEMALEILKGTGVK